MPIILRLLTYSIYIKSSLHSTRLHPVLPYRDNTLVHATSNKWERSSDTVEPADLELLHRDTAVYFLFVNSIFFILETSWESRFYCFKEVPGRSLSLERVTCHTSRPPRQPAAQRTLFISSITPRDVNQLLSRSSWRGGS